LQKKRKEKNKKFHRISTPFLYRIFIAQERNEGMGELPAVPPPPQKKKRKRKKGQKFRFVLHCLYKRERDGEGV